MNYKIRTNLKEKGITLIALVVTIVVLLIIAGISLYFIFGQNGLLQRTEYSHEEARAASVQEERDMWMANVETDKILGTNKAKSENQIVEELVTRKLLREDEKDIILGNEEKGIYAEGEITIARRRIVFKEIYTARGNGTLSEGNGTEENPYLIQSIEDLVTLSNNVSPLFGNPKEGWTDNSYDGKIFKLVVNLDFKSRDSYINPDRTDFEDVNGDGIVGTLMEEMTTGYGFKGIGWYNDTNTKYPFKGGIDGNNKKIKNLFMKYLELGLIGYTEGDNSTFKNLTIENMDLGKNELSNANQGGLIRVSSSTSVNIENCHLSGKLENSGSAFYTGGFVGKSINSSLKFEDCTNDADIYGYAEVGGFVGECQRGEIKATNCINRGTIYHKDFGGSGAGGIVGAFVNGRKL